MKLTFYGAAEHVTGSNHLLEAGGLRILVDCGMIQGSRYNDQMNFQPFGYDPKSIDAVFITHSHVDHMGRLPKLRREGFTGPIWCSEPTAAITATALPDAFDKMVSEAEDFGVPPLYDEHDIKRAIDLFKAVPYGKEIKLNDRVSAVAHDCGHILGSTIWEFTIKDDDGQTKRIAFPGDIGNPPSVLLNPIDYVHGVDYTLVESTYGKRLHEARAERRALLLDAIKSTYANGGVLMIPSFAVERTQEILLEMDSMFEAGELPKMPVFVDSPLAINITKVYGQFSSYFNEGARELLKDNKGLFQFPWLTFTPSVAESKHINEVPAPKVIIAGSGMSQGGRIVHHESRYLPDPKNTILFIGYQVEGSLGRRIRDGASSVSIFGKHVGVHCRILSIGAYSAHADQNGLMEYLRQAALPAEASAKAGKLKRAFVVHGERDSAYALAERAHKELGIDMVVPTLGQSVEL